MYGLVVVGFSAGGIEPMRALLAGLGPDYPLPLAVVTHLPQGSGAGFARLFSSPAALPMAFVSDKQAIVPGRAWFAPPGYHLLVESQVCFALSVDAPVKFVRPSIDVLFDSAARAFDKRLIAVTLYGANSDGAEGMAGVRQRGGMTVALATPEGSSDPLSAAVRRQVEVDYCVGIGEIIALLQAVRQL